MKAPREKGNLPVVLGVRLFEGRKFEPHPPLSRTEMAIISDVHVPRVRVKSRKKYRTGDEHVKEAMEKAQQERKLRFIRACAGWEDESP